MKNLEFKFLFSGRKQGWLCKSVPEVLEVQDFEVNSNKQNLEYQIDIRMFGFYQ